MKPRAEWEPQVYLVGAGPGDPGLLTRRGEALLRRADVIFYDYLTNAALLDLARPDAERIFVGKRAGGANPTQESINAAIIAEARKGRMVVRLKGGDCFVFGRGGEEAEALLEAGVRFEVVPGVTSATAVPALAGIPVTHRGVNSVLHIVTGHEDPSDPSCSVDWPLLAKSKDTIVVLMGSGRLASIAQSLVAHGMDRSTSLAVVQWGTYPSQVSVRSTLGEFLADPSHMALSPPSIAIIGRIAASNESLNWFERRPLFGQSVILTRPEESGDEFAESLREAGAAVESIPVIQFDKSPTEVGEVLISRLHALRKYGLWLILPSPAAVKYLFEALATSGLDARCLGAIRVAVVGERSARDLAALGVKADFIPKTATGAGLAEELPLDAPDQPVIIAGSADSRPELAEGLTRRGFKVEHHTLYQTKPNTEGLARLRERLQAAPAPAIVVSSRSAVKAIWEGLGGVGAPIRQQFLRRLRWFAIGPTTGRALADLGLTAAGIAEEPTAEGLIRAMISANETRERAAG